MKIGIILYLFLTTFFFASGQIGIGNLSPNEGTLLHADDNSGNKGVLLPAVSIIDLNTITPLPAGTQVGTIVFNTHTFTGIGYFFWTGSYWAPVQQFVKRSAKFFNNKTVETINDVNLNDIGRDVEIMDGESFNDNRTLYAVIQDVNDRYTGVRVSESGRYRITVYIGLEQDDGSSGSTAIQARLKINDSSNNISYSGSYIRSTEMDNNNTSDDDGTIYFTEVIELNAYDTVHVSCSNAEGTSAVYLRERRQSAFIIEKIR